MTENESVDDEKKSEESVCLLTTENKKSEVVGRNYESFPSGGSYGDSDGDGDGDKKGIVGSIKIKEREVETTCSKELIENEEMEMEMEAGCMKGWKGLRKESKLKVLSFLDFREVYNLSHVSRSCRAIARGNDVWMGLLGNGSTKEIMSKKVVKEVIRNQDVEKLNEEESGWSNELNELLKEDIGEYLEDLEKEGRRINHVGTEFGVVANFEEKTWKRMEKFYEYKKKWNAFSKELKDQCEKSRIHQSVCRGIAGFGCFGMFSVCIVACVILLSLFIKRSGELPLTSAYWISVLVISIFSLFFLCGCGIFSCIDHFHVNVSRQRAWKRMLFYEQRVKVYGVDTVFTQDAFEEFVKAADDFFASDDHPFTYSEGGTGEKLNAFIVENNALCGVLVVIFEFLLFIPLFFICLSIVMWIGVSASLSLFLIFSPIFLLFVCLCCISPCQGSTKTVVEKIVQKGSKLTTKVYQIEKEAGDCLVGCLFFIVGTLLLIFAAVLVGTLILFLLYYGGTMQSFPGLYAVLFSPLLVVLSIFSVIMIIWCLVDICSAFSKCCKSDESEDDGTQYMADEPSVIEKGKCSLWDLKWVVIIFVTLLIIFWLIFFILQMENVVGGELFYSFIPLILAVFILMLGGTCVVYSDLVFNKKSNTVEGRKI